MQTFSRSCTLLLSLFAVGAAQACGSAYTTEYRYDLAGQVVGVISPAEGSAREALRNTYDSEGRLLKAERGVLAACHGEDVLPANWPNFDVRYVVDKTYDVMGRLMSERRSGPTLAQYSYDTVGRLECTAVRMNSAVYSSIASLSACQPSTQGSQGPDRISRLVYDVAARVVAEQRAYGTGIQQNYVTYGYTPNGRQDWVEDANGNRTDLTYDGFDRLSRMNFPQTSVGAHAASSTDFEAYGYDNNSNLTSKRLRSTETIIYGFDALNRLETKNLAGTATVSYTYDNFGLNETTQIAGGAGSDHVFDGFGRLTAVTSSSSAGSLTLTYGYDEDGNRTRVTWPDGTYVQYTYDGRNRMKQIRENNAVAGPGLLADYSYDVLSRRTYIARGNGTSTTFDYDAAWRLFSLGQDLASTSRDLSFGFGYNSAGQVTNRTVSNDAYSYFSMMQSKSYSRDGRNRYTAVADVAYGYDGRGNLTSDGVRTFAYDLENHLLSVTGGNSPVSLTYDSNGRLSTSTSNGVTTRYLYDGDKLAAEYQGSTLVRRYVHGLGVDEPLVWYEGAGLTDRRWLHADHQGSVVATSNGAGAGTVYAYSAYGEPAYDNWAGSRFRYTGQIMLPEARLYHYKARVYDPVLGRFLQTDPVGYKDDFNLYGYVGNDPVNSVDPRGLARVCTTTTGTRIESCVDVDGNGDGNTKDDDLTARQIRDLGRSYGSFIQANNGKDISKNGLTITNKGASQDAENLTRVVSQFVGTARGGWGEHDWRVTIGEKAALKAAGFQTHGTAAAWAISLHSPIDGSLQGMSMYFATDSPGLLEPSNLSRALIHESLHFYDSRTAWGQIWNNMLWGHRVMDGKARQLNVQFGFGKCGAVGGFPGC